MNILECVHKQNEPRYGARFAATLHAVCRVCYTACMNAKATNVQRATTDTDADIDQFLADNHADIEAKLAAARDEIARGEASPLEPLEALIAEARKRAAR